MSLKDAVNEIADQMDAEAKDILSDSPTDAGRMFTASSLRGFARQLRSACKAAGEVQPAQSAPFGGTHPLLPSMQHILEIEKAKQEIRAQKRKAEGQEEYEPKLVQVIGGPAALDGVVTHHGVEPGIQIGQMIVLCDAIYRLEEDWKLHFDEKETAKYRKSKGIGGMGTAQGTAGLILPKE